MIYLVQQQLIAANPENLKNSMGFIEGLQDAAFYMPEVTGVTVDFVHTAGEIGRRLCTGLLLKDTRQIATFEPYSVHIGKDGKFVYGLSTIDGPNEDTSLESVIPTGYKPDLLKQMPTWFRYTPSKHILDVQMLLVDRDFPFYNVKLHKQAVDAVQDSLLLEPDLDAILKYASTAQPSYPTAAPKANSHDPHCED